MSLINMIAFILALHHYISHLESKNLLGTVANGYDGNSLRRMETDSHYYHSIAIDHCDDFSGSATYDDGDGCCDCDREHGHVRDYYAHD